MFNVWFYHFSSKIIYSNFWLGSYDRIRRENPIRFKRLDKKSFKFWCWRNIPYFGRSDGTQNGHDYQLIDLVSSLVNIPLVVCGGFNSKESISKVLENKKVSGVIGSALHYGNLEIDDRKNSINKGIHIEIHLANNKF